MVIPDPTVAICTKVPGFPALSGARSISKPSSLFELSVQERSIALNETAIALKLLGALIVALCVVALSLFEKLESMQALNARTRYQYVVHPERPVLFR